VKNAIRQAFVEARDGWSADRVVADPELNRTFIDACRRQGLSQPIGELNRLLLNSRKAGWLSGLPRSRRTSFANEEEYRFAGEVAARFLEQREGTTLDHIICDPGLAKEFDSVASKIAPGHGPLQYRWAALNLRKASRLKPELLSHVAPSEIIELGSVDDIDTKSLPAAQGIYIFHGSTDSLYLGETTNLRKRIEKHLDHSDNKGLAHWFWENGCSDVMLEIRILPKTTSQRIRRALERELIESRKPRFNVQYNV